MAGPRKSQRPVRYFAGKPVPGDNDESEDEEEEVYDEEQITTTQLKIEQVSLPPQEESSDGEYVTEEEDQEQVLKQETLSKDVTSARMKNEVVDQDKSSEEQEEESSSEEESSEEEEARPTLIRPRFISKDKRNATTAKNSIPAATSETRKESTLKMIEKSIRDEQLAEAAKFADDIDAIEAVDDTDGLDPEAELAAWIQRERARVKRERDEIEVKEREHEELERRRALTEEERLKEDEDRLQRHKPEGASKTRYMQRYYHKGAFFQDDEILKRDFSEAVEDDYKDKSILPKALQVRGVGIGLKGQTKYRSLREEDTTLLEKDPKRRRRT